MLTIAECSEILIQDWNRLSQIFVHEAIQAWDDEGGQGDFILWIRRYVYLRMIAHVRQN